MKNPYSILGISRSASQDEIKKAYRKLAHQYHPDKKGGNDAKFKEINEAYQILSDEKKRNQYDQFGFAGNGSFGNQQGGSGGFDFGQGFSGFRSGGGFSTGGGFEDIFDLFGDAFGGRSSRHQDVPRKGEDVYIEVSMRKKDLGTTKILEFKIFKSCDECRATGIEKGSKLKTCSTCNGTGQVRQAARSIFGTVAFMSSCQDCKGEGRVPEKLCTKCKGKSRFEGKRKLEIRIPQEIDDVYSIVMPKQGNAGKEGKHPGDLLITLKMK